MTAIDFLQVAKQLISVLEQKDVSNNTRAFNTHTFNTLQVTPGSKGNHNFLSDFTTTAIDLSHGESGHTWRTLLKKWQDSLHKEDNIGRQALERLSTSANAEEAKRQIKGEIKTVSDACLLVHMHLHQFEQLTKDKQQLHQLFQDLTSLGVQPLTLSTFIQDTLSNPIYESNGNSRTGPNCRFFAVIACKEKANMNHEQLQQMKTEPNTHTPENKQTKKDISKVRLAVLPHSLNIVDSMNRLINVEAQSKPGALQCGTCSNWLCCDCNDYKIQRRFGGDPNAEVLKGLI